jgi:hypothetical protein
MLTCPPDFELSGLIDDGLDAQDQAQFVVHLEPVVLHVVLDAGARFSFRSVARLYFTVEFAVPFAAQIGEDFLGVKVSMAKINSRKNNPAKVCLLTNSRSVAYSAWSLTQYGRPDP